MAVRDSDDLIVLAPQNEGSLMLGAEVASHVLMAYPWLKAELKAKNMI